MRAVRLDERHRRRDTAEKLVVGLDRRRRRRAGAGAGAIGRRSSRRSSRRTRPGCSAEQLSVVAQSRRANATPRGRTTGSRDTARAADPRSPRSARRRRAARRQLTRGVFSLSRRSCSSSPRSSRRRRTQSAPTTTAISGSRASFGAIAVEMSARRTAKGRDAERIPEEREDARRERNDGQEAGDELARRGAGVFRAHRRLAYALAIRGELRRRWAGGRGRRGRSGSRRCSRHGHRAQAPAASTRIRAGSGGSGGLQAYQTTPARYAIGTFMTSIRKMNPHHSPDIGGECSTRTSAPEPSGPEGLGWSEDRG